MRCQGFNQDGTPCKYEGRYSGFCARHRRENLKSSVGVNAPITEDYISDYEEFFSDPDPFNMGRETAFLRTLINRLHDSLEQRRVDVVLNFLEGTRDRLEEWFTERNFPASRAARVAAAIVPLIKEAFEENIGFVQDITAKEAKTLADLVKTLTDTLTKWRKMEEERVYTVDINEEVLRQFTIQCVYPVIGPEHRNLIAIRAKSFVMGIIQGVNIPLGDDVIEGELIEPDPEDKALVPVDG